MTLESTPIHVGFRSGQICDAYNEAAFRHFLAVERTRAERAQRPLFLVVAGIRQSPGRSGNLSDSAASALFGGLGAAVREVDFVGWYREARIAGAVLAQGPHAIGRIAAPAIAERIVAEMKKRLSNADSINLRVRVTQIVGGKSEGRHP